MRRGSTARMDPVALYHSAIVNADGTVNVGYLFLFRFMRIFVGVLVIETMLTGAALWSSWPPSADEIISIMEAYGKTVAITAGAMFATALGGVGAFLWGDSHTAQAPRDSDDIPKVPCHHDP